MGLGKLMSDMSMTDLSKWPTKTEAAGVLHVSEKTIDRMASQNPPLLQKATRTRVGLAPVVVFHPGDVEREAAKRRASPAAFVMPADVEQPSDNLPARLSDVRSGQLSDLLSALVQRVADNEKDWGPPLFLTTRQAVQYSGLSSGFLDGLVRAGKLRRIDHGMNGHRYRRADLDQLDM